MKYFFLSFVMKNYSPSSRTNFLFRFARTFVSSPTWRKSRSPSRVRRLVRVRCRINATRCAPRDAAAWHVTWWRWWTTSFTQRRPSGWNERWTTRRIVGSPCQRPSCRPTRSWWLSRTSRRDWSFTPKSSPGTWRKNCPSCPRRMW